MQRSNSMMTIQPNGDFDRQSSYSSFDDDTRTVQYEKGEWEIPPSIPPSPRYGADEDPVLNWADDYSEIDGEEIVANILPQPERRGVYDFILGEEYPTIRKYFNKNSVDMKIRNDAKYISSFNFEFYCAENENEARQVPRNKYTSVLVVPRMAMMHVMKSCRAITAELHKYGLMFLYLYVNKRIISFSLAKDCPKDNPGYIMSQLTKIITQISREVLAAIGENFSNKKLHMEKVSAYENYELFEELERDFLKSGPTFQALLNRWEIFVILPMFLDDSNRRGYDWAKYKRGLDGVEWRGKKDYIICRYSS